MKTVKVKIAVVVDSEGKWLASGHPIRDHETETTNMEEMVDAVIQYLGDDAVKYWFETELPVPEKSIEPINVIVKTRKIN